MSQVKEFDIPNIRIEPAKLRTNLLAAEEIWRAEKMPILTKSEEIKDAFRKNNRILLEAETGSGKSTVAPVLLLDVLLEQNPDAKIAISQPRRISTEENSDFVGSRIGDAFVDYHHRRHIASKPEARITYTIEKSLLNELLRDPMLNKYDAVVLDEIHQRSVDSDIMMALLKQTQKLREESGKPIKLVLTSATLDAEKFLQYFENMEYVKVPGRSFPVEPNFLNEKIDDSEIIASAVKITEKILTENKNDGDILIFMPGSSEINETVELLQQKITDPNIEYVKLLGGDNKNDEYKTYTGKRKIIVATNVAELSLTPKRVREVIITGKVRRSVYDDKTGITDLLTEWHTQANDEQQAGRAGRVAEGRAWRTYTKDQFNEFKPNLEPEILRTNLTSLVLQLKAMGINEVHNFDYIDHPGEDKIHKAVETLYLLGALDAGYNLTDIGREMAEIEADPHYARMIVEARKRDCLDAVSLAIGFMSQKQSIYDRNFMPGKNIREKYRKFINPNSDFLTQLNIWNEYVDIRHDKEKRTAFAQENGINTYTFYKAANERRDLINEHLKNKKIDLSADAQKNISIAIASGFMDSILKKDSEGTYKLENGKRKGIVIGRDSIFQFNKPERIISGKVRLVENANKTFAEFNMLIDDKILREIAPHLVPAEKKIEKQVIKPKKEEITPTTENRDDSYVPPPQIYKPLPTQIPRINRRHFTFKDVLLYIPRQIAYGLKSISAAVGNAIKYIKSWF